MGCVLMGCVLMGCVLMGALVHVLQSQCDWLKGCVTERDSQISSLLDKLHQFNQQYDSLQKFVSNGNELLAGEKPVGENAERVQDQMTTCQVHDNGMYVYVHACIRTCMCMSTCMCMYVCMLHFIR